MKTLISKSFINVIGSIWMPNVTGAMTYTLKQYDIENMKDDEGHITKESVEHWLSTHSRDFRYVEDFYADIEAEINIIIPWSNEENEYKFNDLMYPAEEL